MKLEIVEVLTNDRDLTKRHIAFLTSELEGLKAKSQLPADEELRLKEIELRLTDCANYLANLEEQLTLAVAELSKRIRQLDNELYSLVLFERHVLLRTIRDTASNLGLNLSAAYKLNCQARNAYNVANGIQPHKDPRGRRKGTPNT